MGKYIDINESSERLYTVLDRIGYLSVEQARSINFNNVLADATIRNLVHCKRAFWYDGKKKFLLRQPWRKPYMPVINAVDVMLVFLNSIDVKSIFVKEYIAKPDGDTDGAKPSAVNPEGDCLLLGFARHSRMYEVYAARTKEELLSLYGYLEKRHKSYTERCGDEKGIRYIIMVSNDSLVFYEPDSADYLYTFAYIEKTDSSREVQFYSPQSDDTGMED